MENNGGLWFGFDVKKVLKLIGRNEQLFIHSFYLEKGKQQVQVLRERNRES